nr:methyltransferase domain-containing protein [Streptomyces sp. HNM0574]
MRYTVAEANLAPALADGPARVLDLAGGDGGDALRLAARGHHVTVVDHAPAMLAGARERAADSGLSERVTTVEAEITPCAADLPEAVAHGAFDVVLCHNLIPYTPDPRGVLRTALVPLRPGGLFSVMALNRHSAPLKSALRDLDPEAALAALDQDTARTELFAPGTSMRLHTAEDVGGMLRTLGCEAVRHFGIRAFCDWIADDALKHDPAFYSRLERLELAASARDPYRRTARLFQLTARKPEGHGPAG